MLIVDSSGTVYTKVDEPVGKRSRLSRIFVGSDGLRAGWGCALFVFLAIVLTLLLKFIAASFLQNLDAFQEDGRMPAHLALDRLLQVSAALAATGIMARIEKRPRSAYGFSAKRFGRLYAQGALIGLVGLSLLMGLMALMGGWRYDGLHLHGSGAWKYGLAWAAAFALTAFSEETQTRGYLLAALARGITFWPAAICLALLFGALHLGNGGENYTGIFFAALAGLAFSYMIWKTGSLTLVFGLHAAWDWGESFLYGTPDSGQHVHGYLIDSHPAGNPFISGGSAGPEGSLLTFPVLLLMVLAVHLLVRSRKLPQSL